MFCDEIAERSVVVVDIDVEGVNPVLALVVSRLDSLRGKGIDVAHLIDVDGTIQTTTGCGIPTDDVSHHQSCDVERFRRRGEDDSLSINSTHRAERIAGHYQFTVNLVGDNAHMVFVADISHVLQFFARPDATCGVVGVAKEENGCFLVGTASLEGGPVDLKAIVAVTESQYTFEDFATVVFNGGEEAVVIGREDEHLFARHCQCFDGY